MHGLIVWGIALGKRVKEKAVIRQEVFSIKHNYNVIGNACMLNNLGQFAYVGLLHDSLIEKHEIFMSSFVFIKRKRISETLAYVGRVEA